MSESKNVPLDEQLLTSDQWAPVPNAMFGLQFKDVTLNTRVGEFEAGTKFAFAVLLGDASALILIDENQKEHGFRLSLSVGEAFDPAELSAGHDESCDCGHEH